MSSSKAHHFDSYLKRMHRRWIFWRIIESMGAGALLACLFAFVLSLILFARGESSFTLTSFCILTGIMLGAFAGWITRPSIRRTATEIDCQFNLSDLIGTALAVLQSQTFIADSKDQPWTQSILNIADAQSMQLATQSLLLRRWGVRGWSGIGLSAALMLTFGLLSTNPLISRPNRQNTDTRFDSVNTSVTRITQSIPATPLDNQPESLQKSQIDSTHEAAGASQSSSSNETQHSNSTDQSGNGEGTTIERTHHEQVAVGHSNAPTDDSGNPAIGGGNTSSHGSGRMAGNASASDQTAVRHRDHWSADESSRPSQSADQKVDSPTIPDAYRDLVRDYFQRD